DDEDASAELGRLPRDLHLQEKDSSLETDKEMKEAEVTSCKNFLADTLEKKNREVENVFSHGKPYVTYLLIVINVLMYIFLELSGGSSSIDTLIELGAKYNPDIINGEWWRIISSMFLHIGFLHLAMNMLAIFYLGTAVERIYGGTRFLIIYFLAGIGGGLASFAFTTSVSAGASGAIFGLFGALLFFGLIYKRIFLQTIGQNILFILLINIVFGFLVAQIDMGAHLGGLLAGFIASAVVHLPQKRAYKLQIPAFLLYLLFIAGLITFGIANNVNSQSYQLMQMEQLLADEKYEEAVDIATRALDMEGDLEAPILFQRSYAYIELTEIDRAITDLEQSIQSKNPLPEAYYNLALLYFNDGRIEEAREMISNAFEMEPEVEAYKSLYEEITGESP
ncbi:rhomboid family intramembrane serine protease, partial [Oceanobacillus massiliensis]|uniref:rhomboid family intramembrane serine protease n=1 Tax=Oceanobacillus massiliensis TaxID=1465765 RepID=UPI00301A2039